MVISRAESYRVGVAYESFEVRLLSSFVLHVAFCWMHLYPLVLLIVILALLNTELQSIGFLHWLGKLTVFKKYGT